MGKDVTLPKVRYITIFVYASLHGFAAQLGNIIHVKYSDVTGYTTGKIGERYETEGF